MLHPPQNGRVRYAYTPFAHHSDHVSITELKAQIPAHAQYHDLAIKVPTLEQLLHRYELWHPSIIADCGRVCTRAFKAYLLKESLERLWNYHYEGAMLNYLQKWMDQLKWQRLKPFEDLAAMLLKHLDGIVNYCRTKVRFGVVEAVNGNIRMLINRGRGYKNLRYLLLKAKRMAVTDVEFLGSAS